MDVSHNLAETAFRSAENRLVTALKEAPDLVVLAVVVLAVAGSLPSHDPTNGIVAHLNQKMHVVGHQPIGAELDGEFRFLLMENADKPEVIVV